MPNTDTLPDYYIRNSDLDPREIYEILLLFVRNYGESALSQINRILFQELEAVFDPEETLLYPQENES